MDPVEFDRELDLCNLSSIENIGDIINIKDYKGKINEKVHGKFKNSPFIEILTQNNKLMIIKIVRYVGYWIIKKI